MTVYASSKHPVLIKKISLRIWSLRHEIENVLYKRINYLKSKNIEINIDDIKKEYTSNEPAVIPLTDEESHQTKTAPTEEKGEQGQDSIDAMFQGEKNKENEGEVEGTEDEMAAAIAEQKKGEVEGTEDEMAAAIDQENKSTVEADKMLKGIPQGDMAEAMLDALNNFDGDSNSTSSSTGALRQRRPTLNEDQIHAGKTMLAEIYMEKMFLFTNYRFVQGQSVVIEFEIPKKFTLNADVIFCNEYNLKNRIISENALTYRMAAQFTFLKKGERSLLRQFLDSIEPEIKEIVPQQNNEDDEESIDDVLEGLDL